MWDFKWLRNSSQLIYLGLIFPSAIVVGTLMGFLVDRYLPTDPWGKIVGFLFGAVAGFINFYRDYQKLQREKK